MTEPVPGAAWVRVTNLLDAEGLGVVLRHADKLREATPFPGYIHPLHGDLRPQRLPASPYRAGETPGDLNPIRRACEGALEAHLGLEVEGREGYFLYYPEGTQMHAHLDPDRGDHWRVCVVVRQRCVGGELRLDGEKVPLEEGDAYVFRADLVSHLVTPVTEGERLVWTLAFLL